MLADSRVCACGCGQPIRGDRRKRFFSDACRMRVNRGDVIPLRSEALGDGPLVASARAELDELGITESLLGQTVLALAARMDVGNETGAALSALAKQMGATMAEARASAARPASPVDQLRQKRLERMGLGG